jgi:predicted DCC family thiol-disulfide oxidoreductase YuxK
MKPLRQRLYSFWFDPSPALRLAVLRILLGAYVLWYLIPEQGNFLSVAKTDHRLFAPVGVVFHGPVDPELFHWAMRATLTAASLFILGLGHRVTGPLFAGLLLWLLSYRQSWSMIYHSDNLVVLDVVVLGLTRSADALSIDHWLRRRRRPAAAHGTAHGWQYTWPVRLMCVLVVCAYLLAAVAKLTGPMGLGWMTGQNLRAQMAVDQIRKELLGGSPNHISYGIYDWLPVFAVLSVGSLAVEFLAPLALLSRRLGCFWCINAFLMHWGIFLVMHITFQYQLCGLMFAPFFRVERMAEILQGVGRRLVARPGRASETVGAGASLPPATLYYDGECGLCDRFVRFVLRRDRRACFQFATLQSEEGRRLSARLGLPAVDLQTVVLVEQDRVCIRSTAVLRVCRKLARPWPLLGALLIVPRPWRDAFYSLVARNRKRWFRPPEACPVMPPEWRQRFLGNAAGGQTPVTTATVPAPAAPGTAGEHRAAAGGTSPAASVP